jgi:protein-S-isoprenylcysteine O-methyltransferase Ste14
MYLGLVVALIGIAVASNTLPNLGLAAIFLAIVDRWYIPFEERAAAAVFGEAYVDYCRRTRRWL